MAKTNHGFVPFIHLLRGIAPLLVVWAHLGGAWYAGSYGHIWQPFLWLRRSVFEPMRLYQDGAHLGVLVFFLISGYIISHVGKSESRATFVLKRCVRLLPTLFLAVFLMWISWLVSQLLGLPIPQGSKAVSSADFLLSAGLLDFALMTPHALGVTWTLYCEVMFYVIFCTLIPLVRASPIKSTLAMMAIAAAITLPAHFSVYAKSQSWYTVYLPMFILGRVLYLCERKELTAKTAICLGLANFGLFLYICQVGRPGYLFLGASMPIITYVVAPVVFYGLMVAKIKTVPPVLSFFGRISYSLYLLHYPAASLLMNVLYRAGVPLDLVVLIGIATAIGVSAVVTIYVEEPFQAFARRWMKRPSVHHDIGAGVVYARGNILENVVSIDDARGVSPAYNANA